ncbi:uncharacterized protein METZ01_LOCUS143457 [marine metagenome]|uniref:Uncharacterized protein n=1 Tax=marine metagenome TaxID=408172 RepID=A0A381ZPD9_9ZZZZ
MKNPLQIFLFITIIISNCSKKEIIKLPITTSSKEALEYFERAMLSYQVGDGPECNADLDSALALDPEFAMALEFYESQNQRENIEREEKAKSLFLKISEAEKKIINIREGYREGDMDKALESAKWLVSNHADSYESYVWLGIVQSDRYELEDATQALKKAIELNPDCYDAYDILMGHHIGAGNQVMLPVEKRDVEIGMKYGDELIRIRGDHGYPYHFKANVYRQLGEFEKAKPLYEKSIEKRKGRSSESTAYLVSGHNYMFSGDLKTARERYNKAIELQKEPNWKFVLSFYLTVSHIFDNDYYGALDNINKVEEGLSSYNFDDVSLVSRQRDISWQKLVCYAHNQMEEEAYEALAQQIKYNKQRAALLNDENVFRNIKSFEQYLTAWVNILFGKYEVAKKSLATLKDFQEKRNDPTAMYGYHHLLGLTHLMEGNHQAAVENFQKGDETDIYFNYFKGLSLKATGNKAAADQIFTDIININFAAWDLAIVKKLAQKQIGEA